MSAYLVETYSLKTSTGKPIRQATKVTRKSDGATIRFIDKLSKRDAIANAEYQLSKRDQA